MINNTECIELLKKIEELKVLHSKDKQAYLEQNILKSFQKFKIETDEGVTSLHFDEFNQQNYLISGHSDGSINLRDIEGKKITELKKADTHSIRSLISVKIKDIKVLASAGEDNRIIIWDLEEKEPIVQLNIHTSSVCSLKT